MHNDIARPMEAGGEGSGGHGNRRRAGATQAYRAQRLLQTARSTQDLQSTSGPLVEWSPRLGDPRVPPRAGATQLRHLQAPLARTLTASG